jgi:rhodanese-related sulfurtransferase
MVKSVSPQQAEALIGTGTVDVIDVRDPNEWATGHIPGARHVPLARFRASPKAYLQGTPAIFVCAAGARSQLAAQLAAAHGVEPVYNLSGGTRAWAKAGLQLVTPAQQATG